MANRYLKEKFDLFLFLILVVITSCNANYKVGIGIADCTGPVAEVVFVSKILF